MTIGERLKMAREIRDLTQIEMAAMLKVSPSTVAYIEIGRLNPSDQLFGAICRMTGFPAAFFQKPTGNDFPLGSLALSRYRARAAMTSREASKLHRHAQVLAESVSQLGKRVTTIPLRLPRLQESPESAADITRSVIGLSPDRPIPNLTSTAERAGVLVIILPLQSQTVDAFSLWTSEEPARPLIALVAGKSGDRLRHTLAHELGHLVLHHTMTGQIAELESEATRFAAELLLPETAIRDELSASVNLIALSDLKKRWGVSMQMLVMRAFDLGIITDRQKRYMFQRFAQLGIRKVEPFPVPVERPRYFRQLIETVYGSGWSAVKVANDLALPVDLIEASLPLYSGKEKSQSGGKDFAGKVIPFSLN
jgi:Zn-dependent peptidase ImmA (M78 family)/DNA-binding XRE family transcriptional regulator